jgi:hypothetical protein
VFYADYLKNKINLLSALAARCTHQLVSAGAFLPTKGKSATPTYRDMVKIEEHVAGFVQMISMSQLSGVVLDLVLASTRLTSVVRLPRTTVMVAFDFLDHHISTARSSGEQGCVVSYPSSLAIDRASLFFIFFPFRFCFFSVTGRGRERVPTSIHSLGKSIT